MPTTYDIFLSYATVDDTPLAAPWRMHGDQEVQGWVRCFKIALQAAVDRKLGRTRSAKLFLDAQDLRTGDHLGSAIRAALDHTTLFVALASPGYFHEHSWCKMEREYFIQSLGPKAAEAGRIFGVLLDEEALELWKQHCFPEVRAFPFFKVDDDGKGSHRLGNAQIDAAFINRIDTLAGDLAERIQEIRARSPNSSPASSGPTVATRGTIFVAAVPGEIEETRSELAAFLTKEGWSVVPKLNECATGFAECERATREAAAEALAFVQILSPHPWKPLAYDRAQFQGIGPTTPSFRYFGEEIELAKVRNEEHRRWLQEHDAQQLSFPGIKKHLAEKLEGLLRQKLKDAQPPIDGTLATSFITMSLAQADPADLGTTLMTRLEARNVYSIIPETPPSLEECLLNEHGFLTVYGAEPYERIEKTLLQWRGALMKHLGKLGAVPPCGVFLAAPPPAEKVIRMKFPGLKIIPWDDPRSFDGFVNEVTNYARTRNRGPASP